jgi:hypothetical protein
MGSVVETTGFVVPPTVETTAETATATGHWTAGAPLMGKPAVPPKKGK